MPDEIRVRHFDEELDYLCAVKGVGGAGGDLADENGPADEVGEEGPEAACCESLRSIVVPLRSARGAEFGDGSHE